MGKRTFRRDWRVALAALLAVFMPIVVLTIWRTAQSERRLDVIFSDPVSTVGRWTGAHCSLKSASTEFAFVANGKTYVGQGPSDRDFCHIVELGAQLDVLYYKQDPTINFAGKQEDLPAAKSDLTRKAVFVTSFLLGLVMFFSWVVYFFNRAADRQGERPAPRHR